MAQETVKEVINRIVKSIRSDVNPCYNCINANSAYTVRKVSEEPNTMCNGVDCCDGCRYRQMKTSSTAYDISLKAGARSPKGGYDSVFPLKVSTLIK
jgi:hypothetical protein